MCCVQRGNMVYVKDDGKTKTNDKNKPNPESGSDKPNDKAAAQGENTAGAKDAPSGAKMGDIPEGFHPVPVETGINDSDYIEVISGLSEGDEVYVPAAAGSDKDPMQAMMGMGGGMGGGPDGGPGGGGPGGGGAPSGGAPDGGR